MEAINPSAVKKVLMEMMAMGGMATHLSKDLRVKPSRPPCGCGSYLHRCALRSLANRADELLWTVGSFRLYVFAARYLKI